MTGRAAGFRDVLSWDLGTLAPFTYSAPLTQVPASAPLFLGLQDVTTLLFPDLAYGMSIFTRWVQHQALSWHLSPLCLPATMACLSHLGQRECLLNRVGLPGGSRKCTLFLFPTVSKCPDLNFLICCLLVYGDFDFVEEARGLQTCWELRWASQRLLLFACCLHFQAMISSSTAACWETLWLPRLWTHLREHVHNNICNYTEIYNTANTKPAWTQDVSRNACSSWTVNHSLHILLRKNNLKFHLISLNKSHWWDKIIPVALSFF